MLKVELHTHTADDPEDAIPHSSRELIDRAAALGYDAVAITLHNRQLDLEPLADHAARRGVVLIPGVERTIDGRHVLLVNFPAWAATIGSFAELADVKTSSGGLVIAPHPFFPARHCLGPIMDRYAEVFDAVEFAYFYTRGCNFNRPAVRWARRQGKPLVGNGDVHRLFQLGKTYTLVDAAPRPEAICEAIRAGRVEVVTRPIGYWEATRLMADLTTASARKTWRQRAAEPAWVRSDGVAS